MTYELAKQLKEAGFPQGGWENPLLFYWSTYDGGASEQKPELIGAHECNFGFMEKLWAAPTLEELIEACGEKFGALYKSHDKKLPWGASDQNVELDSWELWRGLHINGATPTEAVANLWLALQTSLEKGNEKENNKAA